MQYLTRSFMSRQINRPSRLIQFLPWFQHIPYERMRLDVIENEMDTPSVRHTVGDGVFGLVVEFDNTSLRVVEREWVG